MSISLDASTDFACFDALEEVTLRQPPNGLPIVVAGALRRRSAAREAAPSEGRYVSDEVEWHLPAAALVDPPAIGAVITDADGVRWVVLAVARATCGTRYACHTRGLSIVGGLDSLVTLERATWIKGPSGAATALWSVVRTELRARIQPHGGEVSVDQQRELTRVTHRIYLADEVPIDHDCRFVVGAEVYRVVGFEQPHRIDALLMVLAEQVTGEPGHSTSS